MSALPRSVKRGFDWFAQVAPYLSSEEAFPCSLPALTQQFNIPSLPVLENSLMHSLEYWGEQSRFCRTKPTEELAQIA
jgi:hypothetical protein